MYNDEHAFNKKFALNAKGKQEHSWAWVKKHLTLTTNND